MTWTPLWWHAGHPLLEYTLLSLVCYNTMMGAVCLLSSLGLGPDPAAHMMCLL